MPSKKKLTKKTNKTAPGRSNVLSYKLHFDTEDAEKSLRRTLETLNEVENTAKKHPLDGKPVYLGTARIVSSDDLPDDTVELKDLDGCCNRGVRSACPACTGLEPEEQDAMRDAFSEWETAMQHYVQSLPLRERIALWFAKHDRLLLWLALAILTAVVLW